MRNQIFYFVLLRLTANDLHKVADEHSNLLTSKNFMKMYNEYQQKGPHEFIIINYKRPMIQRFQHRFTKIINIKKYLTDDEISSSGSESDAV
jgi:hypothetical protein